MIYLLYPYVTIQDKIIQSHGQQRAYVKKRINPFWGIQTEKRQIWKTSKKPSIRRSRTIYSKRTLVVEKLETTSQKRYVWAVNLELTVQEQQPKSTTSSPTPPSKKNQLPAQPGPKKENQWPQNGLLRYIWQAPPPPPGLRTNGILYKSCSILQGVDSGVLITNSSQIRKN